MGDFCREIGRIRPMDDCMWEGIFCDLNYDDGGCTRKCDRYYKWLDNLEGADVPDDKDN